MVLVNTKGTSGSNVITFKTAERVDLSEPQPIEIPWNMSKQILIGKRSDGYQIIQALEPLFDRGFTLTISKGDNEPICVTLFNDKGKARRSGEGVTLSVALRRMSVGMSREYSHMRE